MSTLFLTDDELVDLTGYRQPSKQIGQLKAQRIPFHTNRAGHPKVARAVVEGRKVATAEKAEKPASSWSPSWAANLART